MTDPARGDDIVLSLVEARVAALVAVERMVDSLRRGSRNRPGIRPDAIWQIQLEGAGGELAFAKRLGWYWDGAVGVFHQPGRGDVRHVHVRRRREHHWDLTIRPDIDVPGVYALVTGCFPRYRVHGWAEWPGCATYEAAYNPDRKPALFVAQADLRDLADLGGWP